MNDMYMWACKFCFKTNLIINSLRQQDKTLWKEEDKTSEDSKDRPVSKFHGE